MGLFATEAIAKDEAVVVWSGKIVHHSHLPEVPQDERDYVYQVCAAAPSSRLLLSLSPSLTHAVRTGGR